MQPGPIPGLDGLRAIAILAVLIFHFEPSILPGGFMGVDVFFVVSGFLITTLLLRERLKHGHIDLKMFWIRRARRLIPALVSVIVIVVPLTWLCAQFNDKVHDLLVRIGSQIVGVLTFSYNWVEIAAGTSYFTRNVPQLFTNFWSLAVEEQFYLLWPWIFIALGLTGLRYRETSRLLIGVAGTSAIAMAFIYNPDHSTRVYFGTDTHVFGLMLGAALAFEAARPNGGFLSTRLFKQIGPLVGMVCLLGVVILMVMTGDGSAFAFRGSMFAVSVLTAIVIASFVTGRGGLISLMNTRVLTAIGERSYALYLWHWPLLVLAQMMFAPNRHSLNSWIVRLLAVAVTFAVCEVSLRYLETPIRRRGFRGTWNAISGREATSRRTRRPSPLFGGLVGIPVILAAATIAVTVTAPDKTEVEQKISANEHLVNENGTAQAPRTNAGSAASTAPSQPKGAEAGSEKINYAIPTGPDLTMFGDSMLVTTAPEIVKDYPGVDIVAKSERSWEEAIPIIGSMERQGTIRRAVVVALGTNWGIRNPAEVEKQIDQLQKGRTVVLVNTYGAGWEPAVTDELKKITSKYPNVTLADWNSVAKKNASGLQSDGVHPDYATMPLFVNTIRDAFQKMAAEHPASAPGAASTTASSSTPTP